MRTLLFVVVGCVLAISGQLAYGGPGSLSQAGEVSVFTFVTDQSAVTQTGGFAGVHETYPIQGQFRLTVDANAATASLESVDAELTRESPFLQNRDLGELFDMNDLAGTVTNDTTIDFQGERVSGTVQKIKLTLTLTAEGAYLTGTITSPGCWDCFNFSLEAFAQYSYGGGTGEPNEPYLIYTAEQMNVIGNEPNDWDAQFKLMADIDMSAFDGKQGRPAFKMIGAGVATTSGFQGVPFTGVFDGGGRTVSHVTIQGGDCLGLFSLLGSGAEVRQLRIADANVVGTGRFVGALAGGNNGGYVVNCCSSGAVSSSRSNVGGLVGYNWYGFVTGCYSSANVSGTSSIGGLVGGNADAVTDSCARGGAVAGTSDVGGLVGHNYSNFGVVTQCYSSDTVRGDRTTGGLIGNDEGYVAACYWDVDASGQQTSDGGTGLATAQMQMAETYLRAGWDFTDEQANGTADLWWIMDGRDYPRLFWDLPADDFADGKPTPLWQPFEPDAKSIQMHETDGKLEVEATAEKSSILAAYISSGWRLDPSKDFSLKVDCHFGRPGAQDGWVFVGLIPTLARSIDSYVELGAGCHLGESVYQYKGLSGSWAQERSTARPSELTTLYISYQADADELYLSYTGYGKANAWQTVARLLGDPWRGQPVYIILGGGSDGMDLSGGETWLDNFTIDTGAIVN